jgi:hypothetical protein
MLNTVEHDDILITDVLISRATLSLPEKDFEACIIEPLIARLRARWKNWDGDHPFVSLRVTVRPVSQDAWNRLIEGDKNV